MAGGILISMEPVGLLNWARIMDDLVRETMPAVARALNLAGEDVVNAASQKIAEDLDLDPGDVRSRVIVYQADAANPQWSADFSEVWTKSEDARPWTAREGGGFDDDVLLNIVGYADCCDVCEQIAADGPYTQAQINNFKAEWANFVPAAPAPGRVRTNLLHPNCYCGTAPFKNLRRVTGIYGNQSFTTTPRTLGRHLAEELATTINIVVGRNRE